ncbi:MAG TPA: phosphoribosylanthranilate isomerase [Vicinamibacterales bacterium]|nr:phosphoribosylanthranilate isomerase [Vicinamibacterales bacterium]
MGRLFVKICGITRLQDAELAVELGASALGFVFWPGSPRFIDPFRAKQIVKELPIGITPVGVFVDQPLDYVKGVASVARLGGVQLHGSERPEYAAQVPRAVLKAIPLEPGLEPAGIDDWPARVTLLVDVHDPARKGGTGRTVDWSMAARVARRRRTVLAGGLSPDNVGAAVAAVRPFGVDVSSGVEASAGVKDPARLKAFFAALGRLDSGGDTA